MSTHICMGSMNISITDDVYLLLKGLKHKNESFSTVIKSLVKDKDISKCYGLLKDYQEDLDIVEKEALKSRASKWREIKI